MKRHSFHASHVLTTLRLLFLMFSQVTNGKNAMPAFGGRLSDDEIADVAAYVFKTADSGGWD
jgi:mono/diheme cytochrome c family protein